MKAKIWIITPFAEMQRVAEQILSERTLEFENCQIMLSNSHTNISGFQNSLVELRKAQAWGAEVIVSRGGTAICIAENTDIPVVEIQVTALDILQALRKAGGDIANAGIAGYKNITYECESLYDFLGAHVRQITLVGDDDYIEMQKAVNDGITVLVGDALAIRFASRVGISAFLIESGKASIYKAIKEAECLVSVRRKEQSRAELLRTVIDLSTDGIVAIDARDRITLFNKVAEDLFKVSRIQALGASVKDIIPNTRLPYVVASGEAELGEVQIIGKKQIATKRVPMRGNAGIVGAVATFQEVSQLQCYEQQVRQKLHNKGLTAKCHMDQIIGQSVILCKAKELARKYASTDSTVCITGESGTGKELFAQSIHNLSYRRNAPFVAINCAALPENLLESELFGYEEGAFTGAKKGGKIGLVELAHGGTLFLDEISEMSRPLQARMLRVIQEKNVMRVGGDMVIPVNIRILVATNQNLLTLIANKQFREDLYYRINVLSLHLPPLRERSEDIPSLAEHFIGKVRSNKTAITNISSDALALLKEQVWLGNIREFANVIERLVLLSPGPVIHRQSVNDILTITNQEKSTDQTESEIWSYVEELRKTGLGARKIAKILAQQGHSLKYYQIAYRIDKEKWGQV